MFYITYNDSSLAWLPASWNNISRIEFSNITWWNSWKWNSHRGIRLSQFLFYGNRFGGFLKHSDHAGPYCLQISMYHAGGFLFVVLGNQKSRSGRIKLEKPKPPTELILLSHRCFRGWAKQGRNVTNFNLFFYSSSETEWFRMLKFSVLIRERIAMMTKWLILVLAV